MNTVIARDHIKSTFGSLCECQGLYGAFQITSMNLLVISPYTVEYIQSRIYLVAEFSKT